MRPIYQIANDIQKVWVTKDGKPNVWFGAVPYLDAMRDISSCDDMYGADTGTSIVLYFLSNAAQFRGPQAKALKNELREHCGLKKIK